MSASPSPRDTESAPMRVSSGAIRFSMASAESVPTTWMPYGRNTPLSDSSAKTCFPTSAACVVRYALPPPVVLSSSVHPTTRTVRRGRRPSVFMSRTASHAATTPPASSIAPCPTSHESMWPPITTTSSGFSRPRSSATALRDGTLGRFRAPITSRATIGCPRSCIRCSSIASSTVIAAAGIRLATVLS